MIGSNIKEIRKMRKLTLSELADKANISKSYLSNIERDLNENPSVHIIKKLADVLNVEIVTLLGEETQPFISDYEWKVFTQHLMKLGIKQENVEEYRVIFEFIKWKDKKGK
ncbi:helix-turn-helix transcriptional regulator [Gracilibacillus sp. S3-1-1]|uniref:Helix-turn-helix transcriptional regulator n=1 Tax=Gracilibacillus pellucidus TaxID=3095368 RepID=A0ACC6M0S9_9BACI|nr:helix-turn-helix transcriptional regulator [Gracilibacillus sp. S3-1-1]MDX8044506.1 helix-turn-helix transcriptional regulator [Gracilibacillus sp. S3-1-1]